MIFNSTVATFCAPTSTTDCMAVATNFATSGIILKLTSFYKVGAGGYYFNCDWISN